MTTKRQHFVDFFSPGTIVSKQSRKPIGSWDTVMATKLAAEIVERHNSKPYGFQFVTCIVTDPIPDGEGGTMEVPPMEVPPKEVEQSGLHFLGGNILRYPEVPDDQEHRTLRSDMRCNDKPVCITNPNSWRFTGFFDEDMVVVDGQGDIVRRGDDADLVEYRKQQRVEWADSVHTGPPSTQEQPMEFARLGNHLLSVCPWCDHLLDHPVTDATEDDTTTALEKSYRGHLAAYPNCKRQADAQPSLLEAIEACQSALDEAAAQRQQRIDNHPDNGRDGQWRVTGIRHTAETMASCAREAIENCSGEVQSWECPEATFLGEELPDVF